MRIVLATAFPAEPERPRGGVEAVSVVLVRALAAYGDLDLHVVTADARTAGVERSSWLNVAIHRLPWRAARMLSGALGRDGRRLREYVAGLEPDVIHAHDVYGIMLRAADTPRVLTIHGFIHGDTRVSGERWARARAVVWRRIEHATWARFPHIISISPYVRERLGGIATGAIHDIDNPIDERFFHVAPDERAGRIFSAATISRRKNTLGLIDAVGRLVAAGVDATLTLAGEQPLPAYADAVRARIRQLDLERRVTIRPPLGTVDVLRELGEASVAALISLEENSPLTVQEAMAAGVPVVTSNRCGMPYQVADGDTGFLVDPNDSEAAADRLRTLILDQPMRQSFGRRAKTVACERFHPASVARRTRAVYDRALGTRAVPARVTVSSR